MAEEGRKASEAAETTLQSQIARFALLSEVVLLIAKTPDINRLLNQVINRLKWALDFERCTLALLNDSGQSYRLQTLLETRRQVAKVTEEAIPLEHGIPGEVMRRRQVRLITDLPAAKKDVVEFADPAMTDGTLAVVLSLPLQAYNKMLGAITFSTIRSDGYIDEDIKVATSFATHLALAIDRWQQTEQLQQANGELARLASFPELNPGPIIEADASCCIYYLNPAAKSVFPGLEQLGAEHPLFQDLSAVANFLIESGSDSHTDEIKIDGVWYQRVFHPVAQNERIRIYASDVTERKQAEEATRRQNEYLAALHETSLGLISRLNLNELLSALVTRAGQLLGTSHGYIYLAEPNGTEIERKVGVGVFSQSIGARLKPNEGLAGTVWQSGQPLVVDDYDSWADRSTRMDRNLIRAIMGVPLKSGTDVVGVIGIAYDREQKQTFSHEEVELLTRFGQLASIALDNARLFEAEQHQHTMTESLRQVAAILNASLDRDTVLTKIIDQLHRFISYDSAVILLQDGEALVISDLIGLPNSEAMGHRIPLTGNSPAVRAFNNRQAFFIADVQSDPGWVTLEGSKPIQSWMGVPLLIGEKAIGVLTVNSVEANAYTEADIQLATTFANQAAIAIENARLFEETQAANKELSRTLDYLKATQGQLVEAEKMAALGGLVAGVAHEINTPVGVGVTAASALEDKTAAFKEIYTSGRMKRSDLEKYLDIAGQSSQMILRNLERAAELIHSFKQVAVDQSSEEQREFKVKEYLQEILLSLRPQLKKTQHTITINGDDVLTLDSYPGVFSQIVTNLVMNSLLHAYEPEEAGQLIFDFKQENSRFIFKYSDDGKGIPQENLSKIFDPFFTTKRGQGGSGLGLHIIYNLVTQKLGGTIRCESEVGQGTRFVMALPL